MKQYEAKYAVTGFMRSEEPTGYDFYRTTTYEKTSVYTRLFKTKDDKAARATAGRLKREIIKKCRQDGYIEVGVTLTLCSLVQVLQERKMREVKKN